MSAWLTILASLGGFAALLRLAKEIISPPWVIRVRAHDTTGYSMRAGNALGVYLARRWRDTAYGKNLILVGTVKTDDPDFDEKVLDLRDKAKATLRQVHHVNGTVS